MGSFLGEGANSPKPVKANLLADGSHMVFGHLATEPSTNVFLLHITATGELLSERTVDVQRAIGDIHIRSLNSTDDGGFVVTGEIAEPDQFKNLLLARFDSDSELVWTRSLGRPQDGKWNQGVADARWRVLDRRLIDNFDGPRAVVRSSIRFGGGASLVTVFGCRWAVRTPRHGVDRDSGALLVGDYRASPNSLPQLFVTKVGAGGNLLWEKAP